MILAALALATGIGSSPARAEGSGAGASAGDPDRSAIANELVVGFKPGTRRSEQRAAVDDAGATLDSRIDLIGGGLITADPGVSLGDVRRALKTDPDVAFIEPNYILSTSRIPNDAAFEKQWGFHNIDQLGGGAGADVRAPAAWDLATGGQVTVAVIDTGIATDHPDLQDNLWTNAAERPNGRDDDNNGFVDDVHGVDFANEDSDPYDDNAHGTHVAGIIGARGDNGIGVAGVNWQVRLMGLKFLDRKGRGTTADAVRAIDYATDNGANVINASWGGPEFSDALYTAIARAGKRDVLFVAAAGNEGLNADVYPDYPAALDLPNVVSVAASDSTDDMSGYSTYGRNSVDLAAPGDSIYSTVPTTYRKSGYATLSGTSMATPFVSGAAALYLARYPGRLPERVHSALLAGADRLPSMAGKTVTGGRLNVAKLLGVTAPVIDTVDRTAPSPFRLLYPRNRYVSPRGALRFHWQRARDDGGVLKYRVYVDRKLRRVVVDPDGKGKRVAPNSTRIRLGAGLHRWSVRAVDHAGNVRAGFGSGPWSTTALVYVGRR